MIYLVFNEGYSASQGDDLMRQDLAAEAIRLARLLRDLLPEPEVLGLLALMLLQDSRRAARATPDRRPDPAGRAGPQPVGPRRHRRGLRAGAQALGSQRFGTYSLQAAIAAVHAEAARPEETDWAEIVGLYDALDPDRTNARRMA